MSSIPKKRTHSPTESEESSKRAILDMPLDSEDALWREIQVYKQQLVSTEAKLGKAQSRASEYEKRFSEVHRAWIQLQEDVKQLLSSSEEPEDASLDFMKLLLDDEPAVDEHLAFTKSIFNRLVSRIGVKGDADLNEKNQQLLAAHHKLSSKLIKANDELVLTKTQVDEFMRHVQELEERLVHLQRKVLRQQSGIAKRLGEQVKEDDKAEAQPEEQQPSPVLIDQKALQDLEELQEQLHYFQDLAETRLKYLDDLERERSRLKRDLTEALAAQHGIPESAVQNSGLFQEITRRNAYLETECERRRAELEELKKKVEELEISRVSFKETIVSEETGRRTHLENEIKKLTNDLMRVRSVRDQIQSKLDSPYAECPECIRLNILDTKEYLMAYLTAFVIVNIGTIAMEVYFLYEDFSGFVALGNVGSASGVTTIIFAGVTAMSHCTGAVFIFNEAFRIVYEEDKSEVKETAVEVETLKSKMTDFTDVPPPVLQESSLDEEPAVVPSIQIPVLEPTPSSAPKNDTSVPLFQKKEPGPNEDLRMQLIDNREESASKMSLGPERSDSKKKSAKPPTLKRKEGSKARKPSSPLSEAFDDILVSKSISEEFISPKIEELKPAPKPASSLQPPAPPAASKVIPSGPSQASSMSAPPPPTATSSDNLMSSMIITDAPSSTLKSVITSVSTSSNERPSVISAPSRASVIPVPRKPAAPSAPRPQSSVDPVERARLSMPKIANRHFSESRKNETPVMPSISSHEADDEEAKEIAAVFEEREETTQDYLLKFSEAEIFNEPSSPVDEIHSQEYRTENTRRAESYSPLSGTEVSGLLRWLEREERIKFKKDVLPPMSTNADELYEELKPIFKNYGKAIFGHFVCWILVQAKKELTTEQELALAAVPLGFNPDLAETYSDPYYVKQFKELFIKQYPSASSSWLEWNDNFSSIEDVRKLIACLHYMMTHRIGM